MSEATGATRVDCQRAVNLTNNNAATQAAALYGNGTNFNGTTQSLSTTSTALARANQNFTVGGFFRRTGGGTTCQVVRRYGSAGQREWRIIYNAATDDYTFEIVNSVDAVQSVTINRVVPTNTWVYIFAWNDLTNLQIGMGLYYDPAVGIIGYLSTTAVKTITISNVALATEFASPSNAGGEQRWAYWNRVVTQTVTDPIVLGSQLCV